MFRQSREYFFTIPGYEKHVDITYRQGSVDLGLRTGNQQLAIVEVKRDWDFSEFRLSALDEDALELIKRLRKEHLGRPAIKELFTHIAESFPE